MPKGVPYEVQVTGKGTRTYTFTEIADGTGLSLSLVSLVLRQKRPVSPYFQDRLTKFFGVPAGDPFTISVTTPQPRARGRIVGYRHPPCY